MAELVVSDNLLDGEAGVRDALDPFDREPLVDPILIAATPRNCPPARELVLELPTGLYLAPGQRSDRGATDGVEERWEVKLDPRAAPGRFSYSVRLLGPDGTLATTRRTIVTTVHGASEFEASRHGFPFANSAHLFGGTRPPLTVFTRSFAGGWQGPFSRFAFNRVYDSIFASGLCTGMAMAALQLASDHTDVPAAERSPLDQNTRVLIQTMHGRQLADAALLRAGLDLLRNSPRRSFQAFRRSILRPCTSPLAFHVGVPVLFRRDFFRAVVRQGHTVVPHSYRVTPDRIAELAVYDPAFLPGPDIPTPPLLRLDLARDTYSYRDWSSDAPGNRTTITVAPLTAYSRRRSRIIASISSLVP